MTPFLKGLLDGGAGYSATLNGNAISVQPTGDNEADLIAFQSIVHRIQDEDGNGFTIHHEHIASDTAVAYIDEIVLRVEQASRRIYEHPWSTKTLTALDFTTLQRLANPRAALCLGQL